MKQKTALWQRSGFVSLMASLLSIAAGLIFGFLLLLILNPANAAAGMGNMLSNGIRDMGNVLYRSTPLIMTGLCIAFAYKVGLFNIGASGQYTMGAFFALVCAIGFRMPWYLCLLAVGWLAVWYPVRALSKRLLS